MRVIYRDRIRFYWTAVFSLNVKRHQLACTWIGLISKQTPNNVDWFGVQPELLTWNGNTAHVAAHAITWHTDGGQSEQGATVKDTVGGRPSWRIRRHERHVTAQLFDDDDDDDDNRRRLASISHSLIRVRLPVMNVKQAVIYLASRHDSQSGSRWVRGSQLNVVANLDLLTESCPQS